MNASPIWITSSVRQRLKRRSDLAPKASPQPPIPFANAAPAPAATASAPTSAIGQTFGIPGQVIDQTKAMVEKINPQKTVLDGVPANPQGTGASAD